MLEVTETRCLGDSGIVKCPRRITCKRYTSLRDNAAQTRVPFSSMLCNIDSKVYVKYIEIPLHREE